MPPFCSAMALAVMVSPPSSNTTSAFLPCVTT